MLSDMSYFASEKGLSELTSSTDHERFYNKWEKIISSGMQDTIGSSTPWPLESYQKKTLASSLSIA